MASTVLSVLSVYVFIHCSNRSQNLF